MTIRKPNQTQDGAGQLIEDWTTEAGVVARDVPAAYQAVSGGERARGVQIEAGETALFTLRYRTDVDPTMRIYWRGNAWNIMRAVDPDGLGKRLLCTCGRVV